jgi:uncharacterized protein with HEPN domain
MQDDDRVRILHMIDATEALAQFTEGRSRDDLNRDRMLLFALVEATTRPASSNRPGLL